MGSTCPADGWPAGLPENGVLYVRPGASIPPDGTAAAPYADPAAALAAAGPDTTTLALAVGEYTEHIYISSSIDIVGACPEGTILRAPFIPLSADGASHLRIENLSFVGDFEGSIPLTDVTTEVRNVAFENVFLAISGPRIVIEDVVFRGNTGPLSHAVITLGSGEVSMRRVLIEDRMGPGIAARGDGAKTLMDVYLRNIGGSGLSAEGTLTIDRLVIDGSDDLSVALGGTGQLHDVVIRDILPSASLSGGLMLTGDWNIEGLYLARIAQVGLIAGEGTITLQDAVIEGAGASRETSGRGIVVAAGASFAGERIVISDVHDVGLLADRRTTLALTDTTIRQVEENPEGGFGRCVHGQHGASLTLLRVLLDDCTEAGLTTALTARAVLHDVRVRGVRPTACPSSAGVDCSPGAGFGLLALPGGAISAERFVIEHSALAGIVIANRGETDLRDGIVRNNPIGVNIQHENYDLRRVMTGTRFIDNVRNLDTTDLPLPTATAAGAP